MPNNSVSGDRPPEPSALALSHSENFEPAIQDTLSALANIEVRYQYERKRLERRSGPEGAKTRRQQALAERRRKEREPLVHHLAKLHQHTMTLTLPAQVRVLVIRRPKYACRACEDGVVQAPAPARLIEGGLPTDGTVAQ